MQIEYFYEPHFPIECAMLIQRALANPNSINKEADIDHIDAIIAETERDYPSRVGLFKERLTPLREVMDYVMNNLNVPRERLEFYFSQTDAIGPTLARFERLGINLENETPENREHIISTFLQTSVMPTLDSNDLITNASALADWLDKHDGSASLKWSIMRAYQHFDEYRAECADILAQAEKLYREKESVWQPVLAKCIDEFKAKMLADNGAYLENSFHVKYEVEKAQFRPSLVCFNALSLVGFEVENVWKNDCAYFDIGYMIEELLLFNSQSDETGELLYPRLKAISDKRRLEILTQLYIKPLCGQEIAEKLGLTPATISHHMNELVCNEFVDIVKEGTRLNYSFSKTGMQKFIADLGKSFK